MTKPLPRFVIAKTLASGATGFYFNIPTSTGGSAARFRTSRWVMTTRSLAVTDGNGGRAAALNELFDEWNHNRAR